MYRNKDKAKKSTPVAEHVARRVQAEKAGYPYVGKGKPFRGPRKKKK